MVKVLVTKTETTVDGVKFTHTALKSERSGTVQCQMYKVTRQFMGDHLTEYDAHTDELLFPVTLTQHAQRIKDGVEVYIRAEYPCGSVMEVQITLTEVSK